MLQATRSQVWPEKPVTSRRQIEAMIAEGRHIIIIEGAVVKCDAWLSYHPGGDLAIKHMVGRDATDEFNVMHSSEAKSQMMRFQVGRIEGTWKNFVPPVQGGVFRPLSGVGEQSEEEPHTITTTPDDSSGASRSPSPVFDRDHQGVRHRPSTTRSSSTDSESVDFAELDEATYLDSVTREKIRLDFESYPPTDEDTQAAIVEKYWELHEKIKQQGLFDCDYNAYAVECCRYAMLLALSMFFVANGYVVLGAFALGCLWHQLVFTAHDAGHMGITHNFQVDSVIAIFIADFMGGLSMGWWKRNHNVHHIVTNAPEHDPDIEHMPLFAISHRFLGSLRSTFYNRIMEYDAAARVLLRVQAWTYYPLLVFGRFNLYFLSWDYLLARRGPPKGAAAWFWWLEMAGQAFFFTWYGYGVVYKMIPDNWSRLMFVLVSNMTPWPLHLQIVQSHFAMSTADLGPQESFAQKMLRTTMDIDCPEWLDFLHGGLQFQAIHHLYPRIPRHNLRKTQHLVQEFCNDAGIPYALYGFADCNREVIGTLSEVSKQAAILAKCQQAIVDSGNVSGHFH
jgi:delta8-fatty-acid desaturase